MRGFMLAVVMSAVLWLAIIATLDVAMGLRLMETVGVGFSAAP